MLSGIDLSTIRFDEPEYLWLLSAPALFLALWFWLFTRQRGESKRFTRHRTLPLRERFPYFGGLLFWLCVTLASAFITLALARPVARVSLVRTAGIDLVILQDGSTSMRVTDVTGNRWQRSMRFLRLLGESLTWKDDRIAMALFARIATPQVRLTKDPNTYFFFLDHLSDESPFRLEDDTSWDTNVELGVYWGLRLVDKDERLHGRSPNAKAFVLISDGQAWTGEVQKSLALARARRIPVFAIGVGTSGGGFIPEPPPPEPDALRPQPVSLPIHSMLDRASLADIAAAGGGQYFELDRETDRQIANTIISEMRRRAGARGVEESAEPLYWRCLLVAAVFVCLGALSLRETPQLWLQIAGAATTFLVVDRLIR